MSERRGRQADWFAAAERGDAEALAWHLGDGHDVDARDRRNQTALMVAAHRGHDDAVRVLVEHGAALDPSAKFGLTPLLLATIGGHVGVVRLLVAAGADVARAGTGAGFAGKTALALAREAGHTEIETMLERRTS